MPNSIGVVDTTLPNLVQYSLRFIDADGNLSSFNVVLNPAVTDIQINALLDAIGAASNASLYQFRKDLIFGGLPDKSLATSAVHESVADSVVLLGKDFANQRSQDYYIPAPLEALFVTGTSQVNVDDPLVDTVITAINNANLATEDVVSVRFSQRRKTNERTRV